MPPSHSTGRSRRCPNAPMRPWPGSTWKNSCRAKCCSIYLSTERPTGPEFKISVVRRIIPTPAACVAFCAELGLFVIICQYFLNFPEGALKRLSPTELMDVHGVARYLGINEKKIYFLAKT